MSEAQPAAEKRPIAKRGSDGRILSTRALEAMGEATRKRHEKARIALAQENALANTDATDSHLKVAALLAFPGVLDRWIRGALGRIKGWPASAQLEAGKLVAGVAGIALEARAGGGGPLSEMTLADLQTSLAASLESVQKIAALEGQSTQVPDYNETEMTVIGDSEPSAPIEAGPVEPAPGSSTPDDAPSP